MLAEAGERLNKPASNQPDTSTVHGLLRTIVSLEASLKFLADEYLEHAASWDAFRRNVKEAKVAAEMVS